MELPWQQQHEQQLEGKQTEQQLCEQQLGGSTSSLFVLLFASGESFVLALLWHSAFVALPFASGENLVRDCGAHNVANKTAEDTTMQ